MGSIRPLSSAELLPLAGPGVVRSAPAPAPLAPVPSAAGSSVSTLERALASGPNAAGASAVAARASALGLPPTLSAALAAGVAVPRSATALGVGGVLKPQYADRLIDWLAELEPPARARLLGLVESIPGARGLGAQRVAQALVLKAALARRDLATLQGFARDLAGMDLDLMLRSTTLLDVDARANGSTLRPERLDPKVPLAPIRGDRRRDNDGFIQAYDSSCGPAAAAVLLGEADPVFALAVSRAGGLHGFVMDNPARVLERTWLRRWKDPLRRRDGDHAYRRLKARTQELVDGKRFDAGDRLALLHYARTGESSPRADAALAVVRRSGGAPTDAELLLIRVSKPAAETTGSDGAMMLPLLNEEIAPAVGARFVLSRGKDSSIVNKRLARLERAAAGGGFIFATQDHWWAVTDFRAGRFLVHDTWTGITAWVTTESLTSGEFQRREFRWSKRAVVATLLIAEGGAPPRPRVAPTPSLR